ncbi:MAG: ComEC/Rec2 family competence protein [Patescibacteria group bacterium]
MIAFVVSFVIGIVFEKIFGLGWSIALLIILVSVTLRAILWGNSSRVALGEESQRRPLKVVPKRASLTFFAISLAFSLGILRMNFVSTSPDTNLYKLISQKISFEATISDEPDIRDTSVRYIVRPDFSLEYVSECTDIFLLENSSCSAQSASQGIHKHIPSKSLVLLVANRYPEFQYGDKIKVSGKLDLPKNFVAENGTEFDYISYLAKDKIHFLIYRPQIEKIEGYDGSKIITSLYLLKNKFIEKISAVVPEPNASLLGGVIFGVKQSLGTDLLDDFRKVGLIHIVVLSGYNITIIAVGIFYLTSFLGRRKLGFVIGAVSILLFAIMVGLGATVIRACIMSLISILAVYLGRPSDALRFLFIAGFLMLLWNPLLLFYDPSFQLSFMATLGLILFSPFIFSFITEHKFGKFISIKFGLREIVSSTLAVQFFVLPLLIKMSGFVSLISFLVNPIVLPLVPWAMAFGALTGALGIFSQMLSWPFGVISYFISQIIIYITELSANIPLATLQTGSISIWLIFVWYVGYGVLYKKLSAEK